MDFKFIETEIFTDRIQDILPDDEYSLLQEQLIRNPLAGDLIRGGKGIRKYRWRLAGKGKSGGIRVLYYLYLSEQQIYMLDVYKKSDQIDLDDRQLSELAEYVKKYLKS